MSEGPEQEPIKVGDKLAFDIGYGRHRDWQIETVTKVTPTGRIVCGRWTLNPDLSVRGRYNSYRGPYEAVRVTPRILADVRRNRMVNQLSLVKFKDLPDEALEAMYAALPKEPSHVD